MEVETSKRTIEKERDIAELKKVILGVFSQLKNLDYKFGKSMPLIDQETEREYREIIYTLEIAAKGTLVEISGYEPNKDGEVLNSQDTVLVSFMKAGENELDCIYAVSISGGVTDDSAKNSVNIETSLRETQISFDSGNNISNLELEIGPGEVLRFINY